MNIKRMIYITLFTTLISVFTVIIPSIDIPLVGVSITLQTMMVMLAGFFLKPIDAFLSMILYIFLGLIGLPIFSKFNYGLGALIGPTGGFILSFPIASYLISFFKGNKNVFQLISIALIFGVGIVYLGGAVFLSWHNKVNYFLVLKSLLLFLPVDLIKVLFAVLIYNRLKNLNIY